MWDAYYNGVGDIDGYCHEYDHDHNHHTANDVDNKVKDHERGYDLHCDYDHDDVVGHGGWINDYDYDDDDEYNDDDYDDDHEYDSEK